MRRWILILALLLTSVPVLADGLAALRDGNEAYRAGELEDAVDAFTHAIAYNNRGEMYDDLGDYDRAISPAPPASSLPRTSPPATACTARPTGGARGGRVACDGTPVCLQ